MYQHTLEASDVNLWIPKLIYRNNKNNDNTMSDIKHSNLMISRKGNFTRRDLDVLEETEVFRGKENPIHMTQSYTKEFKCEYNFQVFPFDNQVRNII